MATSKQHGIAEEASALGDRASGAIKDKTGELLNDPSLERRGAAQTASGRARQEGNRVTRDTGQRYVTSLYEDPAAANRAFERLRARDYASDDIDVVMSDETRRKQFITSFIHNRPCVASQCEQPWPVDPDRTACRQSPARRSTRPNLSTPVHWSW